MPSRALFNCLTEERTYRLTPLEFGFGVLGVVMTILSGITAVLDWIF